MIKVLSFIFICEKFKYFKKVNNHIFTTPDLTGGIRVKMAMGGGRCDVGTYITTSRKKKMCKD